VCTGQTGYQATTIPYDSGGVGEKKEEKKELMVLVLPKYQSTKAPKHQAQCGKTAAYMGEQQLARW
jgi:hypothetical protein